MNDENVDRELILVHDIVEDAPATSVNGFTNDDALLDMFWHVCGRESDAWLLQIMGILPEWWRPVHLVRAMNLGTSADLEDQPHQDALSRWDNMTVGERRRMRYGWRVVPTLGGGRIYRTHDPRMPMFVEPEVQAILDEMPVKVLGPSLPYPRALTAA